MKLIKEIYDEMMLDTKQSKEVRELELQIFALARKMKVEENQEDELTDLLFEAGRNGREAGFVQGFRFAVVLMAECFN